MLTYIARRLLTLPLILVVVTMIAFLIMHFAPGDPAAMIAGSGAQQEQVEAIRKELGLDQPLINQLLAYIGRVLKGDFGRSYIKKTLVMEDLKYSFSNTLYLVVLATIWPLLIAIPMGIFAATHQNTIYDRACTTLSVVGLSAPIFFVGLLLGWLFGYKLRWLPISGIGRPILSMTGLRHLVLPAFTLGVGNLASLTRLTRSSMLEVLRQDYIKTARSKGLKEWRVVYEHALRNAALPIWTVVGIQFAYMLAGAVITETIFAWPGLGYLTYTAITQRDFPTIQGALLVIGTIFVLVNLIVDVIYAWLDPRIQYE